MSSPSSRHQEKQVELKQLLCSCWSCRQPLILSPGHTTVGHGHIFSGLYTNIYIETLLYIYIYVCVCVFIIHVHATLYKKNLREKCYEIDKKERK